MDKHEPVGFFSINDYGNWEQNENGYGTPFYTAPPKKEWVGLTPTEFNSIKDTATTIGYAITKTEAMLKEKNT